MLVDDLICSEPDTLVGRHGEREHVIDERLALRVIFWRAENLGKHLLHQLEVRCLIEGSIKRNEWSTVLKAIARKF